MTTSRVKLYAHPTCPMVPPVRAMLNGANCPYDYINIHEDDEAREFIKEVNNGFESVPTLLFSDGTTLTEPSTGELKTKLNALGYHVPVYSLLIANLPKVIMFAIVIFMLLRILNVI